MSTDMFLASIRHQYSTKTLAWFVRFAKQQSSQYEFMAVACEQREITAAVRQELLKVITNNGWREDNCIRHVISQAFTESVIQSPGQLVMFMAQREVILVNFFHLYVVQLLAKNSLLCLQQTWSQFQFVNSNSTQSHLVNSRFFNFNSIFYRLIFYLLLFTMSRYSEYLHAIPTPSSLYSKQDCHGRNISELKN